MIKMYPFIIPRKQNEHFLRYFFILFAAETYNARTPYKCLTTPYSFFKIFSKISSVSYKDGSG